MTYFAHISERQKQYEDLASQVVEMARAMGADEAMVRINGGKGLEVSSRHCEVENLEFNQLQSLGVTVSKGMRNGMAATTDLNLDKLKEVVASALNLCEYTSPDDCSGLCEAELLYKGDRDLELCYPYEEDPDTVVKRAIELDRVGTEKVAQFKEQGLRESDGASYYTWYGIDTMASSNGFVGSKITSDCSKDISFIAEKGEEMQRSGSSSISRDYSKLWDDERVVDEAIEHTLEKMGATQVKTGTYNVILTRSAAQSLINPFLNAISGKLLYRNSSFLCESLGKSIFPEFLSIKEDPWVKGGLSSANFDRDGVATKPMDLIKDGVLCNYLLDTYTSRKMKMQNNGHASGSYNLFVIADKAHTLSFEDMLKEAGSGLVVTSLMGQGVNIINGNYSRGASGYYFENGKRVHAVNEVTIAANLKDMFSSIAYVGNDYDERYRIKMGSIMLPNITVSGS